MMQDCDYRFSFIFSLNIKAGFKDLRTDGKDDIMVILMAKMMGITMQFLGRRVSSIENYSMGES